MKQTADLLIVDDDTGLQRQLKWAFDDLNSVAAVDRESAIAAFRRHEPPVVLLDLGLPPDRANVSEGMAALEEMLRLSPLVKIVVITGNDEREHALKAVSLGAYDFCAKPLDPDTLRVVVDRAIYLHGLELENRELRSTGGQFPLPSIITGSPEMLEVCRTVEKVAPTDASVLLTGESGTGKEILAREIHRLSNHSKGDFVAINCAAIPENLLESELFGYERGAFTGATKQTRGKIEYADGGTLFLDEIGDMPLGLQAKLLRFLQERVIERVGGRQTIAVDVRVVSATNKDLQAMIGEDQFREDLFYRLSELTIDVPPLRDRTGDAALLAQHFLARHGRHNGSKAASFAPAALQQINEYRWPGNVRELENRVKRASIMASGKTVTVADLGLAEETQDGEFLNIRRVREEAERSALLKAMGATGRNIAKAAELLGVSRPTLYDLLEKHGLK
jgi:two-component system NtrC family response regulator